MIVKTRLLAVATAVLTSMCVACSNDGSSDRSLLIPTAPPSTSVHEESATVTVASVATPPELVDRWVGPPRTIGALGTGSAAAFVVITDGFLEYETGIADNPKTFASDVVPVADDIIELRLDGDVLDCVDGSVGHYRWSLSPQATTLTFTGIDDDCAVRRAGLEGSWTHTGCQMRGRDCLGIVEAGTYSTNRWNPYGGFTYGEATFTLPDGWAVTYDSQAALFLGLADDYATSVNGDPEPAWGLRAWADVAASAPDPKDCGGAPPDQPDPVVGLGAENIADWVTRLPSLEVTRSTMTISGLEAQVVDAEIAPGASICNGVVVLTVSRTSKPDPFNYGIVPDQHMRIILIDVLPERTVAIFLDDSGHPGFEALERVAMPIVESFVFSPTPPTI